VGAVLGLVAVDDDFGAGLERLFRDTAPEQHVRRARFNRPRLDLAVRLFHVDVNPDVRVHPFDARHGSLQRHFFSRVEFGRKRVVRLKGDGAGCDDACRGNPENERGDVLPHRSSPLATS
jgi:hypothetical protein